MVAVQSRMKYVHRELFPSPATAYYPIHTLTTLSRYPFPFSPRPTIATADRDFSSKCLQRRELATPPTHCYHATTFLPSFLPSFLSVFLLYRSSLAAPSRRPSFHVDSYHHRENRLADIELRIFTMKTAFRLTTRDIAARK